MSNYFSRLVARSLDPASAVQPRLGSRFEPGGQSLAYDGYESAVTEPVVDVADVTGRSSTSKPTLESRPQRPVPIPASVNKPALKSGTAAAEVRAQATVEDFEETPARLIYDEVENQPQQKNESMVDVSPAVAGEPIPPGPLLKTRRRVSPVGNSAAQSSFPVRLRDNDWTHSATTPPIVQVSIGRVEVRAVLPVPPLPGKNPQAASKVSLQEHLRNGGRR